jgi:hypothetical protein
MSSVNGCTRRPLSKPSEAAGPNSIQNFNLLRSTRLKAPCEQWRPNSIELQFHVGQAAAWRVRCQQVSYLVDTNLFVKGELMTLRRFIIERAIPEVGTFAREQLRDAAKKSNEVLHQLGPDIQWVESYVADDKTFCVYLARDEAIIRKHAEISGFPATKITEVKKMIDPTTAAA